MNQKLSLTVLLLIAIVVIGVVGYQALSVPKVPETFQQVSRSRSTTGQTDRQRRIQRDLQEALQAAESKLNDGIARLETVMEQSRQQSTEEEQQKLQVTFAESKKRLRNLHSRNVLKILMQGVRFAVESPDSLVTAPPASSQLSWRVHLLPLMGEQVLYDRFRLNEPWDSEHNRQLLSEMPTVYRDSREDSSSTTTRILAICGDGFFGFRHGLQSSDAMSDPPQETFALIVVNKSESVPWTAPLDFECTAARYSEFTEQLPDDGFVVSTVEGAALSVRRGFPFEAFRSAATIAGGEADVLSEL